MDTIGIRELRQYASRYIRRVRAGEVITITDNGEPVAELHPIAAGKGTIARLEREGRITTAAADLLDLAPMLPPDEHPSLSQVLEELRTAERF